MIKSVETLRRGLQILSLVERQGPISQADIARETGLPKTVVHRLLHTLAAEGYARVAMGDQLWRATGGPTHPPMAGSAEALSCAAAPVLEALCGTVFWPSDVSTYADGAMRIVEHTRRNTPFVISRFVAPRIPVLQSGCGRALLAWASPERLAQILREVAASSHPRDALARDQAKVERLLDETRARGYANRDPLLFGKARRSARISEVALPILSGGHAIASINLCWATSAMSEAEFVQENLEFLRSAAAEISETLES